MKKNKLLIVLLITFISFCFGINGVKALPTCDLDFYNAKIVRSVEAGNDLTCSDDKLCAKYLAPGTTIWRDTGVGAWGPGSRYAGASFRTSEKNTLKSYKMTIWEEFKNSSGKKDYRAVCDYFQEISGAKPGQDYILEVNIEKNEKDSSGNYKYGHIFSVHFTGKYIDDNGKEISYNDDHVTLKRKGQYYSTNGTPNGETPPALEVETTTGDSGAPAGIEKASKSKEITKVGGNSDLACDTIGELFDEYWPYVMVIVPILLIIMMTIDFFKAMSSSDADAIKKAGTNALKRTIAVVILLALPALLNMLFNMLGLDFCL